MSANGSADAHATSPKSARNGTWTIDASGIQWAFEGIGRVGSAGILPPTSAKIQMKSTLKPCPAWSCARDVDVVRGVGVGRVREVPDEQRPDDEGERV